jgi:hypothetical protein
MARSRLFQQVVRALFKGFYFAGREPTEEDKQVCMHAYLLLLCASTPGFAQVCTILLEWACADEDLVASQALPELFQRRPRNYVPIVCVPFVFMQGTDTDPHLHELHIKGTWFLREFLGLVHRLESLLINSRHVCLGLLRLASRITQNSRDGVTAAYEDTPPEARREFVAAAREYARAIIRYPLLRRGTLDEMKELLLDHLPFAELQSWTGEAADVKHRRRVGATYYAVFGEPLDDLRVAQIICRHVNHSYA